MKNSINTSSGGNSSTLSLQQNISIIKSSNGHPEPVLRASPSNDNIASNSSLQPKQITEEISAIFKKISSTEQSKQVKIAIAF